jgi:prepilin-type N-terminal cleavage/methylation domain-containing protein
VNVRDSQAGYTLTEVLMAVIVLAIGVFGVLTAMSSSILGSRAHRSVVTADAVVRSYGEQLLSNSTTYRDCALPANYPAMVNVPQGYVARIVSVEYSDGASPTVGFANTLDQCQIGGDNGIQRITLEAHQGVAGSQTGPGHQFVQVLKRKP